MNLDYFIAKRLITAKDYKSSISAPIIKIAIAAIAIGMVMMIGNIPYIYHYNEGISFNLLTNKFDSGIKLENLESYIETYKGDII